MIQRTLAFLVAILALAAANAHAELIDSFGLETQLCWVSASHSHDSITTSDLSAIGGQRNLALRWLKGGQSFLDVLTGLDGNGLSFTQGTGQADTIIAWGGLDSSNLPLYSLNADLQSGGQDKFLFNIPEVTSTGLSLKLTVSTADGYASQYTTFLSPGNGQVISAPYTDFTQVGANGRVDFLHVREIVLELNGQEHDGSDITIHSIETAAPEPSTLAMAAIGAVVFLGVRRRRRPA